MNKIEILRLALLTLEQAESKGNCEYEVTGLIRAALAQPELNARELAKMRRSAWENVRSEYKDDPECCFSLGFDAGYDAVARRVEPPLSESGAGFESLPASPIAQPEPEPFAYFAQHPISKIWEEVCAAFSSDVGVIAAYTTPPKSEWVGLTDVEKFNIQTSYWPTGGAVIAVIEAKLKEKNT